MTPSQVLHPEVEAEGFETAAQGLSLHADAVVVGSGPGGAATARVLAEGGLDVMVLEEGPRKSRFRPNHAHTARFHLQEHGAMLARGSHFMPITAGRGVGGSTLVNGALAFRAPDAVMDHWAELLDDPGWSAQEMRPLFDEVEALVGVAMTPQAIAGGHNKLVARGVAALGLKGGLAPRNTPGCVGCGVCNYGCPTGGKAAMHVTLLPRAVAAGARIQAEVRVDQVLVEEGVQLAWEDEPRTPTPANGGVG